MNIRKATRDDVPEIVRLLADDILGSKRESLANITLQSYYNAFDAAHDSNLESFANYYLLEKYSDIFYP